MHSVIIIAGTLITLLVPDAGYIDPIGSSRDEAKYENLINLANSSVSPQFVQAPEESITYEELRYYALYNCKNSKKPRPKLVDLLIKIEKTFNPPPEMRGMILAAACMESGFNPNAKGDRKFSKNKKTPLAIGILQMWPIYKKMYPGVDRRDPESAATAWMKHIVKRIPGVKKKCRYKTEARIWLAAWVTGIRYKKVGGRCKERPLHYRLLQRWHRDIREDRQVIKECEPADGCGC